MATTAALHARPTQHIGTLARVGIGVILGALSGALLLFAFQPVSIWPLAFVAFVPMLVGAHRIVPQRWAGVPIAIGNGLWLGILLTEIFGLNQYTWFFPAIALLIALISFVSEPTVRAFHLRTGYRWFILLGACSVVGTEMIRSFIPMINTHLFMVQTVYTQPWLLQPISVFTIYGLGLLIVLVNYALALALMGWIDHRWRWYEPAVIDLRFSLRWLAGVAVLFAAWCAFGFITLAAAPKDAPTVRVAAIQHGFLKPGHQDPGSQTDRLRVLSQLTRTAAAQGAKLMVWPELALGFDPQLKHTAELKALAAETGAYLLIGYGITDDPRGWRNEMVMLTPEGNFLEVYGKNHPSSPGEPPIATAGVYPVYETPFGKFSTLVCNDMNFTDTTRILASRGAQLVAMPTFETSVPGFHFEIPIQGVLRAVENRVATVKADSAFSALIADPYGRILARRDGAPNGEAFALVADVPLGSGNTFSMRAGDWIGWICLAGMIVFTIAQNMKPAKKAQLGSKKP